MRRRMVRSRRTSRTQRFHMPLSDSCMVVGGFDSRTVLVSAVLLAPAVVPPALPRVRWQLRCAFIFHNGAQALAHCSRPGKKQHHCQYSSHGRLQHEYVDTRKQWQKLIVGWDGLLVFLFPIGIPCLWLVLSVFFPPQSSRGSSKAQLPDASC